VTIWRVVVFAVFALLLFAVPAAGQDATAPAPPTPAATPLWHYGAFADVAYLWDSNHPANDVYRFRSTTAFVDDPVLDMAAGWIHKDATEQSRWGMDFYLQGGKDSEGFGLSPVAPNLRGYRWLRHLGPANVSYVAPIGKGLTVQAGIFSSLIGYDSLYAKDNLTYIRPWGGDYTPYLMMGVNVSYPFTPKLTATAYVVNAYDHLSNPNSVPSGGGQVAYKYSDQLNLKETVFYGPQQADTALRFCRFFSDTIAERKTGHWTLVFEGQYGEEKVAEPGTPRGTWAGAAVTVRWTPYKNWSLTASPEAWWDSRGRWTGTPQTLKAFTGSFEYRIAAAPAGAMVRLEYHRDTSHGDGAGFFYDGYQFPGQPFLRPSHNVLLAAVIFTLEGSHR
jgi:hypothetical protein